MAKSLVELVAEARARDDRAAGDLGRDKSQDEPLDRRALIAAKALADPLRGLCAKCGKQLGGNNRGTIHTLCEAQSRPGTLLGRPPAKDDTAQQMLVRMLKPMLKKAARMEALAAKLEGRMSLMHQKASALRDAAAKIRALADSTSPS